MGEMVSGNQPFTSLSFFIHDFSEQGLKAPPKARTAVLSNSAASMTFLVLINAFSDKTKMHHRASHFNSTVMCISGAVGR